MADLKLPRLPDRTPIKLTITLTPDLKKLLDAYLALYQTIHEDRDAGLGDIIPAMLEHFLAGDRAFAKARKSADAP
jgi:hypothetical protein